MTDERKAEELDEKVEDLDVPEEERDDVKGGEGNAKPNLMSAASGEHFKKATIIN
jgi:hypothetical protein